MFDGSEIIIVKNINLLLIHIHSDKLYEIKIITKKEKNVLSIMLNNLKSFSRH